MITKDNEPIVKLNDGGYVVQHGEYRYVVRDSDPSGAYKVAEIEAYLAEHPDAVQPEPTPPAPTPEELKEREIAEKLAYLASTDWYVTRLNDPSSGEPIPDEILSLRTAARNRIDELRVVETL